ncbi:hypothetical protein CTA1_845 [Colletotrichum tanaceti]|uniref:Uncharacterized protein n=1 Tax=Colletotrichum tanaceti TaxID=1306861 RepID=A0A4U6X6C0_9PEZI|nr:hypothetical protein CTA1_845 [Colletotrichum tanaceti]
MKVEVFSPPRPLAASGMPVLRRGVRHVRGQPGPSRSGRRGGKAGPTRTASASSSRAAAPTSRGSTRPSTSSSTSSAQCSLADSKLLHAVRDRPDSEPEPGPMSTAPTRGRKWLDIGGPEHPGLWRDQMGKEGALASPVLVVLPTTSTVKDGQRSTFCFAYIRRD